MTNAKRQKKFRDKMREIKNSPAITLVSEPRYTERATGKEWRMNKFWPDHDHVELVNFTQATTGRTYRKSRIVSNNVLKVNYVAVVEKVA